jgi:hypothetical protein
MGSGDAPEKRMASVKLLGPAPIWAKQGGGWTAYPAERAILTEGEASALIRSLGIEAANARMVPEKERR